MKSIKFVLITAVLDVTLQKFVAVTYYSLIPFVVNEQEFKIENSQISYVSISL